MFCLGRKTAIENYKLIRKEYSELSNDFVWEGSCCAQVAGDWDKSCTTRDDVGVVNFEMVVSLLINDG